MRTFTITPLSLVLISTLLPALPTVASTSLPVQVIENQGLPGVVNSRTAIANEMNDIKQLGEELTLSHTTLKEDFERTINGCENEKCKVLELQRVSKELSKIETGFRQLEAKALNLLQGDMANLPGILQEERKGLVNNARQNVLKESNDMLAAYMEVTGGKVNIDMTALPLESKLTLDKLSFRLDEQIEALQFTMLDIKMIDYHLEKMQHTQAVMEVDVQTLARNALNVGREKSGMERTAASYIRYGVLKDSSVSTIGNHSLSSFAMLPLPDVGGLSQPMADIVRPSQLDLAGKFEKLAELQEFFKQLEQ